MVVQHLHTVPGVSSNLTFTTMFGLKVFMDAHQPVTLKEGDRYPLGPPKYFLKKVKKDLFFKIVIV